MSFSIILAGHSNCSYDIDRCTLECRWRFKFELFMNSTCSVNFMPCIGVHYCPCFVTICNVGHMSHFISSL